MNQGGETNKWKLRPFLCFSRGNGDSSRFLIKKIQLLMRAHKAILHRAVYQKSSRKGLLSGGSCEKEGGDYYRGVRFFVTTIETAERH
jgi:hypothetical protein